MGDHMNAATALKWFLRYVGLVSATAVIPAIMPLPWMDYIHQQLGMGPLPQGPVVAYLARSLSGAYAVFGAFLLVFSLDLDRYLPLIYLAACSMLAAALGLAVFHQSSNMPVFWQRGEPTVCLIIGAVLLLLARTYQRQRRSPPPTPTQSQTQDT